MICYKLLPNNINKFINTIEIQSVTIYILRNVTFPYRLLTRFAVYMKQMNMKRQ